MPAKHWSTDTYSVRERFGLGVILLATAYVAAVFAAFSALGAPWQAPTVVVGMLFWVGIAQLLAARIARPRLISILAGAIFNLAWLIPSLLAGARLSGVGFFIVFFLLSGAFAGYMAGAIDASLFLVHDFIRDTLRAKRLEREALQAANGETPRESPFDD